MSSVTSVISNAGDVFTEILSLGTQLVQWIIDTPLALVSFLLMFIGLGINIVLKFTR